VSSLGLMTDSDSPLRALALNCTLKASPVPGQAWTYWNKGPGPGEDYLETDEGHEWSRTTAQAAAANLAAVAGALRGKPMPAPPS